LRYIITVRVTAAI